MIRKLLVTCLFLVLCVTAGSAQTKATPYTSPSNEPEEAPVVFRDRLIMDVYHSFWMGMPSEVDYMKFDPGFSISGIWDFKLRKKPIAVGLGLGVSYFTQFGNAFLHHDKAGEVMRYEILPPHVVYKMMKMQFVSVNIPLEFRYRHPDGFKISAGVRAGLVAGISQKYRGQDPAEPSDTLLVNNMDMRHKLKYNVEVYARIGWKFVDVYYAYQCTPLFADGKGPKIRPMSLGLSLSIF